MEHDHEERPGWVRLPGYGDEEPYTRSAARARDGSVRRMRHAANWTAAALIVGVAAATGYFVHQQPAATQATSSVAAVPSGITAGAHKPAVTAPVATSGGSGVTAGGSESSYRDN